MDTPAENPPPPTDLLDEAALASALTRAADRGAVLRGTLKRVREALRHHFELGVSVPTLVRQYARAIDGVLTHCWNEPFATAGDDLALVAVGGYGRGDLHPASDVDILVLVAEGGLPRHEGRLERFLGELWDLGLEVGHSVRTVDQCVEEAARDITVATNLMEARLLAGSRPLFRQMQAATGPGKIWSTASFFAAKRQEQIARHRKFGDTGYNVEPNVKEGPGGLRDIQVIAWVLKRHFGTDRLTDLITTGFLSHSECTSLVEARDFLWKVRFALHVLTGRREDRLLFDHQRAIARLFGYRDQGHRLAVEQFMRDYYRTIGELSRLNEMLLQLFEEALLLADHPAEVVPINSRFRARNGFVEVTRENVFQRHPFALLEVFFILQQQPELAGVRASTIRLIREHRHLIDDDFRRDIRNRSLFLEIIRQPRGLTHELRRMHRYGVLAAFIPAFAAIVGQMQYDLFHVYTVDEHTLFVVRNLRRFAVPEYYDEFPLCSEVVRRLPKPELLYLAGLFHDIAKGRGGDHSTLGAEEALQFCSSLGLSRYDARLVAWLVQHHLTMSGTAQRQDIADPEVVERFAELVGDTVHLNYLYPLTVADIRGTSPKVWNSWKDALLKELYHATVRVLRRADDQPRPDRAVLVAETQAETRRRLSEFRDDDPRIAGLWGSLTDDYFLRHSPDELARHTRAIIYRGADEMPLVRVRQLTHRGGTEVFFYLPDRDYLFATATATMDQLGLTIMDARIFTSLTHMALDTFIVLEEDGEPIRHEGRLNEIADALRERLARIDGPPPLVSRRPARQLKHFKIPTEVTWRHDPVRQRTTLVVVTVDRPGLLARIATILNQCGASLQNAKIATFGERVEDIFFVTDRHQQPLDEDTCQALREGLLQGLQD